MLDTSYISYNMSKLQICKTPSLNLFLATSLSVSTINFVLHYKYFTETHLRCRYSNLCIMC